ncbi:13005_t:CDS:2 [Ambispora gerdemannii]|uniref:13005_t:CDS:1 n=1 Tax=Ambispora gerdemannii TaxID=144530 RepID=A0A9N9AVD6_9GLOM|nr:13005_t:CDS:2 [Ambispora gerdemannii]
MSDKKFTAIPMEPEKKALDGLANSSVPVFNNCCNNNSNSNCCNPALETSRRAFRCAFRKAVFGLLAFALIGRLFMIGLGGLFYNYPNMPGDNLDDTFFYMPISDDIVPENDFIDYSGSIKNNKQEDAQSLTWGNPDCVARIKWQGAKEILLDPEEISGLLYSVKGASSKGSVIIRQDPLAHDYINVTNRIYLSEDSLQSEVKVNTQTNDEDFSIEVKSPTFDGPRPTRKCVRIDTVITLPSRVNHFRSLAVDVPNAWVTAEDLNDVDFAYLNLKTTNGHVTVDDVKVESADIGTVNGHISGDLVVSESLEVKNANGVLQVKASLDPWAEDVSIVARSINGQIDIRVRDIKETQTVDFYAKAINGGIVAVIDDTFEGDFSATTLLGYTSVQGHDLHFNRNSRTGKVGFKGDQGGEKLSQAKLETVTGSIELSFR